MTNAFAARHQNQEKIENLYQSIAHVLNQMADLRTDSKTRYEDYLCQSKKVLPRKEELSISAEIIAACLSDDEDERRSICASLNRLARSARIKRRAKEWNKKHPDDYDELADKRAAMPALKTSEQTRTRHYAKLDDNGMPIRKWDTETTLTTYYLDMGKKG